MTKTPWIKLFALGAMVWVVFGVQLSVQTGAAMGVAAGFLVLLMLLDAAQSERLGEEERGRLGEAETGRQAVVRMLRRLMSRSVAPFYLALAVLTLAGWSERQGEGQMGRLGDAKGMAAARGWGAEAGSGHQPGKSGLCACGKPLGHDKAGPPPPITPEEAAKRAEAIQKRTMKPVPLSLPAASLPGIGPNAKPLPPGLKPNPDAKLPTSAQKLLDSNQATNAKGPEVIPVTAPK